MQHQSRTVDPSLLSFRTEWLRHRKEFLAKEKELTGLVV
jgi:predicted dithiol-disulfide oxidoreductase (DUF899 family)